MCLYITFVEYNSLIVYTLIRARFVSVVVCYCSSNIFVILSLSHMLFVWASTVISTSAFGFDTNLTEVNDNTLRHKHIYRKWRANNNKKKKQRFRYAHVQVLNNNTNSSSNGSVLCVRYSQAYNKNKHALDQSDQRININTAVNYVAERFLHYSIQNKRTFSAKAK